MHQLADHPGLGHLREHLADEALRVWTVHSYLVIYRPICTAAAGRSGPERLPRHRGAIRV